MWEKVYLGIVWMLSLLVMILMGVLLVAMLDHAIQDAIKPKGKWDVQLLEHSGERDQRCDRRNSGTYHDVPDLGSLHHNGRLDCGVSD